MASGLSSAVGFKNGTDGSLQVALNALQSVASPHSFLGISAGGQVAVMHTRGNPDAHLVLRGGSNGPNYDAENVARAEAELIAAGLAPNIMVDCSHANSNKDHNQQPVVAREIAAQIAAGNRSIIGLMLESNIGAGSQPLQADLSKLEYGVSITDACIDWETTEDLLRDIAATVGPVLEERNRVPESA
jgi:3-deoxy-7-phosphoheptulonate synthase